MNQNLYFVIFEVGNNNKTDMWSYLTRTEAENHFDLCLKNMEDENVFGKVRLQHNNWCRTHEIECTE